MGLTCRAGVMQTLLGTLMIADLLLALPLHLVMVLFLLDPRNS